MIDEVSRLLAVNGFLPHGYCISWSPLLMFTFVISDILIFLAYFSMPVALVHFARQRHDFPYRWLLWLFAAFIMACGTTHLMGVVVLWQPLYNLDALLKAVTALVSVATAVLLWPLIPRALKLAGPDQLRRLNAELQSEIVVRKRVEEDLRISKHAAEESLLKERMLMVAIVESSDDAIIGKTLSGIITSWNQGAARMFGYSAEEIIGQSVLRLIPAERLAEETMVIESISGGRAVRHFETQRLRKDGSLFDLSVTVSPIRDKNGLIIGASKIARDISERKLAEAKIQELNNNLEIKVVARTAELKAANEELDAFAYAVTHDLRAPLRAMTGFSRILLEDFGDQLEPEARENLDHIIAASGNMGQLIEGLLVLSRVTRGELQREEIDVTGMSNRLCTELGRAEPGRSISCEIEPGLTLWGDPRMVESLLRNLLGNAWKYTLGTAHAHIRVCAKTENDKTYICVEDNGAGFDMAYAAQLFQPFRRLHRQEEFPGLGIGLATVQRIVHRHGGNIIAQATPGKGAAFFFCLPGNETKETE